jgi:hypothetical protein
MMDISLIVDVLTLIAILSGVIFGIAEIRRARYARHDEATNHIFDSGFFDENIGALLPIFDLPELADAELVLKDKEFAKMAQMVSNRIEFWGMQVYEGKIELHTLDLIAGATVRIYWNRLQNFIFHQRERYDSPNIGEWFQWLAERLDEYPASGKEEGAHIAFRDWKP